MRSPSPSADPYQFQSAFWVDSKHCSGVRFQLAQVSLQRRAHLAREVRDIWLRYEFANAGDSPKDLLETAALEAEIQFAYAKWGLIGIEGLLIDGHPAAVADALERGPEVLIKEVAAVLVSMLSLTEAERKN